MKREIRRNKCRKILKKCIIAVNGSLLCALIIPFCALFVMIDAIWLLTDGMIKKLDSKLDSQGQSAGSVE